MPARVTPGLACAALRAAAAAAAAAPNGAGWGALESARAGVRVHACGHIVHHACMLSYAASLKQRAREGRQYEARVAACVQPGT